MEFVFSLLTKPSAITRLVSLKLKNNTELQRPTYNNNNTPILRDFIRRRRINHYYCSTAAQY